MRVMVIILFLFFLFPVMVLSEERDPSKQLDLSTNPGNVMFDLSNMKPGDSINRNLVVSNNGIQDFSYIISNNFKSGDLVFYNQLNLIIENENRVLYDGKLNKFERLDPRILESSRKEYLYFNVKIPVELGNEFQGLESDFQFKIYVEGTLGGVLPVDNKLPTTGSEMFNLLATGTAILLAGLILFAYVKRKKLDTKRP